MTTALLCTGLESATLPTRLIREAHKWGSLSLLEDTLNTTGGQNVFDLHASVTSSLSGTDGSLNGHSQQPGNGRRMNERLHAADSPAEPSQLDLDYSPSLSNISSPRAPHVFAQVECERDHLESDMRLLTLTPEERQRRRLNEESVVEMLVIAPYPVLIRQPKLDATSDGQQLTSA